VKNIKKEKHSFVSVINDVPLIKELYNEFIRCGFTEEQSLELIVVIVKLILK
jgi:hypothetical protein